MCKVNYKVYSVEAVANCVLKQARDRGIEITNLKLQKLVYFVQGFALAQLEHPLFQEEIQAWTYGPVIPKLYRLLKRYGSAPITGVLAANDNMDGDKEACSVVRSVLDKLGNLTSTQLVRLSHMEHSPWDAAQRDTKYSRIPLWQMAIYFKDMLSPQPA